MPLRVASSVYCFGKLRRNADTNSGVVSSKDPVNMKWLGKRPQVRDIPCKDLVLTGAAFRDLDEQTAYELTKALFEAVPEVFEFAPDINPDLGSATPIPLHPGAARYYRERELLQ